MRGLIGLSVVSALVLGAVDAADATEHETCASCRCVLEMRVRTANCCVPETPMGLAPGAENGAPKPSDVSACWLEGQFDTNACNLLCEQLSETPILPPNCSFDPISCKPGEGMVKMEVAETVGVGVGEVVPCDECPHVEAGQCNDGVNNDAFLDELTDIEDPDCKAATPAASPFGMAALLVALAGFGAWRLRRSRAARLS